MKVGSTVVTSYPMRIVWMVLAVLSTAGNANAQLTPLDFDRPGPEKERQMYYASVRTEINELLIRWQRAWDRDDAAALSRLYASDASYLPHGSPKLQTREVIRDYFASLLTQTGDTQLRMADFGTSGDISYVTVQTAYQLLEPGKTGRPVVRTDVFVLRRRSNQWQIELHMVREEP